MEGLTREEAIRRHRQMWSWIAVETLRLGRTVTKDEARKHFNWGPLVCGCWLCELNGRLCADGSACVLQWPGDRCAHTYDNRGLYTQWLDALYDGYVQTAANTALKIAALPEKGGR